MIPVAAPTSYFDLLTVHQNLLELLRQHPEDEDLPILLLEAERQRDIAFEGMQRQRKAML